MRACARLTVLMLSICLPAEAAEVQGRVMLRTEDNQPVQRFIPGRHRVFYSATDVPSRDCGKAILTNSLEIAKLTIKPPCSMGKLQVEMVLDPNDLSLLQVPRPMTVPCKSESCDYVMEVRWPRKKSKEQREAFFQKGKNLYATDPEGALAYLAEAAWGAGDYTEKVADQIAQETRPRDLWMFLDTMQAGLVDATAPIRSRLLVRQASAASAAQQPVDALNAAAEALKLSPENPDASVVAMNTLVSTLGTHDSTTLSGRIKTDPGLSQAFSNFFSAWRIQGKPPLTPQGSFKEEVAFVLKRAGTEGSRPHDPSLPEGDEMEAMMKGMGIGEEHKALARLVGDWSFTTKTWMSPAQAPMESTGTMHAEAILGGRYVQQVWRSDFMGTPFEARRTDAFDNVAKKYVSTWIDNLGTGISISTGTCTNDNIKCTYLTKIPDPMSGNQYTSRSVITWLNDDTFIDETFGEAPSGKEIKLIEIVAKRKKR